MARLDLLARIMRRRRYQVELDGGLVRRARLAHDRMQREWERANGAEPLEPVTFEECLASLVEEGLESDEKRHGLAGSVFGDVVSREVMDEHRRRGRERRGRD